MGGGERERERSGEAGELDGAAPRKARRAAPAHWDLVIIVGYPHTTEGPYLLPMPSHRWEAPPELGPLNLDRIKTAIALVSNI